MKIINFMAIIFILILYNNVHAFEQIKTPPEVISVKGSEIGHDNDKSETTFFCLYINYPEKKAFDIMYDQYHYKCKYKSANLFGTSFYDCEDLRRGSNYEFEWRFLGRKHDTCVHFMKKDLGN